MKGDVSIVPSLLSTRSTSTTPTGSKILCPVERIRLILVHEHFQGYTDDTFFDRTRKCKDSEESEGAEVGSGVGSNVVGSNVVVLRWEGRLSLESEVELHPPETLLFPESFPEPLKLCFPTVPLECPCMSLH